MNFSQRRIRKPRLCFINTDWNSSEYRRENNEYGGVGYYRLVAPMKYLKKYFDIDFYGTDFGDGIQGRTNDDIIASYISKLAQYDLVYTKIIDPFMAVNLLFFACDRLKTPVIVDMDDNVLEIGKHHPAYNELKKGSQARTGMLACLSLADAIVCSTEPLKKALKSYFKKLGREKRVYVLENMVDPSDWKFRNKKGNRKLGWHGSITHDEDLKLILPAVKKVLQEREEITFELMGGIGAQNRDKIFDPNDKEWNKLTEDKVFTVIGTQAWKGFPKILMSHDWTIGLAPVVDNAFNHSKSAIKWFEYTLKGIPTIASDTITYNRHIRHMENGMLCKTEEDWYNAINYLFDNPKERRRMVKQAKKDLQKYLYRDRIGEWVRVISTELEKPYQEKLLD